MLRFGQSATRIVLCDAHTVLKTSSGKIRHAATMQALMQGKLDNHVLKDDVIVMATNKMMQGTTATEQKIMSAASGEVQQEGEFAAMLPLVLASLP